VQQRQETERFPLKDGPPSGTAHASLLRPRPRLQALPSQTHHLQLFQSLAYEATCTRACTAQRMHPATQTSF
jgi:hypothetical protein